MYINPIVLQDSKIVLSQPDYEKMFLQYSGKSVTVNDSDLIERDGKKYANIEDLNHELKEIEIPADLTEARAYIRKENAIRKDSIFSMNYQEKKMFFLYSR